MRVNLEAVRQRMKTIFLKISKRDSGIRAIKDKPILQNYRTI
jgi:hypothetical protein